MWERRLLFADAEGAEDDAEEVFGVDLAGDFAEEVEGFAEVDGGEFDVVGGVFEKFESGEQGGAGVSQVQAPRGAGREPAPDGREQGIHP